MVFMKLVSFVSMVGIVPALAVPCFAQQRRSHFYEIGAGVIAQESQFNVRSRFGATAGFAYGGRFAERFAVAAVVSGAMFAAPTQFISPAGCFGAYPCTYPLASTVRVAA